MNFDELEYDVGIQFDDTQRKLINAMEEIKSPFNIDQIMERIGYKTGLIKGGDKTFIEKDLIKLVDVGLLEFKIIKLDDFGKEEKRYKFIPPNKKEEKAKDSDFQLGPDSIKVISGNRPSTLLNKKRNRVNKNQ